MENKDKNLGKQIVATNPQTTAIYRFIGKDVYIKVSNLSYAAQLLAKLKEKGAKVIQGRNWIKVDMFGDNQVAKMGGIIIDLETATNEVIQDSLCDFFYGFLNKSGFKCAVSNL